MKEKFSKDSRIFTKKIWYAIGSVSRKGVDVIEDVVNTKNGKRVCKSLGTFRGEVENGWKTPDKLLNTTMGKSSFGLIMGSCSKYGVEYLGKTCKVTAKCLGKAYKKGRIKVLIAMWKAEHPNANKIEEEQAINQIKKLYTF